MAFIFQMNRGLYGGRNCCVVQCANSGKHLKKWSQSMCTIHRKNFEFCPCPQPFTLIPFPSKNLDLKEGWVRCVNRTHVGKPWIPNAATRICSRHFEEGHSYPILDMGHDSTERNMDLPSKKSATTPANQSLIDHNYECCSPPETCDGCIRRLSVIHELRKQVAALKAEVVLLRKSKLTKKIRANDEMFKKGSMLLYTGIEKESFDSIYKTLEPKVKKMQHWRAPTRTVNKIRHFN